MLVKFQQTRMGWTIQNFEIFDKMVKHFGRRFSAWNSCLMLNYQFGYKQAKWRIQCWKFWMLSYNSTCDKFILLLSTSTTPKLSTDIRALWSTGALVQYVTEVRYQHQNHLVAEQTTTNVLKEQRSEGGAIQLHQDGGRVLGTPAACVWKNKLWRGCECEIMLYLVVYSTYWLTLPFLFISGDFVADILNFRWEWNVVKYHWGIQYVTEVRYQHHNHLVA